MASGIGWNVSWCSPLNVHRFSVCAFLPAKAAASRQRSVTLLVRVIVALSAGRLHWADIPRQCGENLASSESYAAVGSKLSQFCRHRVKVRGEIGSSVSGVSMKESAGIGAGDMDVHETLSGRSARGRFHANKCGTNRLTLVVTYPSGSRIPIPHGSPSTSQLPSTTR
jgi:hypothetical protein